MELDLKKESLDVYEAGGEWIVTQEETAETIVPDYCPDIARIIETEGKVCIHSREIRDGKAEVSGTVRVTVLYTPEGESRIRMMEFALPFSVESDQRISGCSYLAVEPEMELLESRMLNPRKIFTHCKLVTRLVGYRKKQLCFCTDVGPASELQIEKRQEQQRVVFLSRIAEKDFTFSEELKLSPGRPGAVELLSKWVRSSVTETKIVGNKLIFKGLFYITCLYRTVDGACGCVSGELPFSQIMEVDGAAEGATASLQLQLTGMDIQLDGEDSESHQFAVTLYIHAAALLYEEREITLLHDLYSTSYEVSYEAEPLLLHGFFETVKRRQNVREVLELGVEAQSVLNISVACGAVSISRERDSTMLRTRATVRVLYLDEGSVPLVAERCLDVSCPIEMPDDCQITARAFCLEEAQGVVGDKGIEVRFPIDFRAEAINQVKRVGISSATLDLTEMKDLQGAPSLVLRCLGKQETAWDLAKRYHTTISAILAANQLERESDLPREQLLLIPRKRA